MTHHLYFQTSYRRNITSRLRASVTRKAFSCKAFFTLCIAVISFQTVTAQCTTFHDADSANPILHASPVPQNIYNLQFVDIDGDGDKDCYILSGGGLQLYRNTGTTKRPQFELCPNSGFENSGVPLPFYGYSFVDVDKDGDFDFVLPIHGLQPGGIPHYYWAVVYYLNIGTPQNPQFVSAPNDPFSVANYDTDSPYETVSMQDADGDGDLDFYIAQNGSTGNRLFLDSSTVTPAAYAQEIRLSDAYPNASFYDFTGDGLPDLVQNDGNSLYKYSPNTGTLSAPRYDYSYTGPHPDFGQVAPFVLVDLNNDGAIEEFSQSGHYATLAPVAVISKTEQKIGNRTFTKLAASQQKPGYTYNWEYNGKIIAGYSKPFIYALKKGGYVLYITDNCGTGVSLPYTYTGSSQAAGIEAGEMTATASVAAQPVTMKTYPNPFTQSVTVQLQKGNAAVTSTLRITDMAGRAMLIQTTSAASITVGGSLPKGTYLLQVWQKGACVYRNTVLKQ